MATTLATKLVQLIDNWGPGNTIWAAPQDGVLGTLHHNVATAYYDVGTRLVFQNSGSVSNSQAGPSEMRYLKVGTQSGTAIAALSICTQASATVWGTVSNDKDAKISYNNGTIAVALSAMTDAYFGWFWTGGVVPAQLPFMDPTSTLIGNLTTDDSVTGDTALSLVTASDIIVLCALANSAAALPVGWPLATD